MENPTYELMFAIGRIYSLIAPILVENDTLPYGYKMPYTKKTNINYIIRNTSISGWTRTISLLWSHITLNETFLLNIFERNEIQYIRHACIWQHVKQIYDLCNDNHSEK